jgi:hypothetical protein
VDVPWSSLPATPNTAFPATPNTAGGDAGAVPIFGNERSRLTAARPITFCVAVAVAWCALLAAGWWQLLRYTYRPVAVADALPEWPRDTAIARPSGFRIVMFVHPMCPCTAASIAELDNSLTRIPAEVSVTVVAVTAGLAAETLDSSRLVAELRALPRISLQFDATGAERQRFGAVVSGEVFAFQDDGRRVYHGGMTSGRGHVGESIGQQQLEALARGESATPCDAPVFGCLLPGAGRSQ